MKLGLLRWLLLLYGGNCYRSYCYCFCCEKWVAMDTVVAVVGAVAEVAAVAIPVKVGNFGNCYCAAVTAASVVMAAAVVATEMGGCPVGRLLRVPATAAATERAGCSCCESCLLLEWAAAAVAVVG